VLKRDQFKELREEKHKMLSVCPLKKGSLNLIMSIIEQTIDILGQNNIKYFHLGADEVFNIGSCDECKLFVREASEQELYSRFLRKILKNLNQKYNENQKS
jgi:hypothetical protein